MNPSSVNEVSVKQAKLAPALHRVVDGRHHDAFEVLGRHREGQRYCARVYIPHAQNVSLLSNKEAATWLPMQRIAATDFFEYWQAADEVTPHLEVRWRDRSDREHRAIEPYTFAPQLQDFDLHLFGEGKHWHIYRVLGAHPHRVDGIDGILFATWAPNAERISVVGDFNDWDGRRHPMRVRGGSGVWELFLPNIAVGALYKFEVRSRSGEVQQKADPYGAQFERRPQTASIIAGPIAHQWSDSEWLSRRTSSAWLHAPLSIYEVHLGSWQRHVDGGFINYRELAQRLVDYVKPLGFTHIELLPITEHPLDDSWGYQSTGYYAPTSRFGDADDFRFFVDHCHQHGIGVLLDWVPAHFPKDAHALARFDGTPLYEHADPQRGEHRDWGTLIYNFGRNEVKNFLLANANFWLEEFHLDGLRVDAVASMLYLDYSRKAGEWQPNIHGGNENLEAIAFLRELNELTHGRHPGTLIIAEESTAWPQVTRPTWLGGLGFSMKWNMGWMHDSLDYLSKDPIHRHYHHDRLTFGLLYAFSENFVLPFSHDEVVHGKYSMIEKMPGDLWQKFANLRLLYTYMYTYPGAKLLFMGAELGQWQEWSHARALDWPLLDYPNHRGLHKLVGDLNHLYRMEPSLHRLSFAEQGFEWIDCHDATQSVISYLRKDEHEFTVVILNFTPLPRRDYRIGLPRAGVYRELLNSDSEYYAGSNLGNAPYLRTVPQTWMGRPHSLTLTLPPLSGLVLKWHED
ncbi:MAG TPA: 1,4-alpha-glucan branching protein GlgB [Spongiibacteraceae bacterium]|nr:1,4-alpha-glucan branching protein GlgB [Spongiibacteraceae bacterium]